jgi:hypothetical protein
MSDLIQNELLYMVNEDGNPSVSGSLNVVISEIMSCKIILTRGCVGSTM